MKKRRVIIGIAVLAMLVAGGIAFAAGKGNNHWRAKCREPNCKCSEFWSTVGSNKCYNCGHGAGMHTRK